MNTNFKNLVEFQKYFKDEETCRKYLEANRWPDGIICPFCQSLRVYRFNDDKRFKCAEKTCNKKFTVTIGTMYENSKVPLQKWFLAMYIISNHKKGISSCQLARDLGVTQKTAWFLNHRIREMHIEKSSALLRDVVEIDETFIGGKYKNKHADKKKPGAQGSIDKTTVFGAIQRHGKVKAIVVGDRSNATLLSAMVSNVEKDSIMVSDEWYHSSLLTPYYKHVVLQHKIEEYVRGAFHTNSIEGFWSILKRGIYGIYHYVSPKHLHRYCNEFTFRFNTRKIKDSDRFGVIIKNSEGRLKYKDLISNNFDKKT